MPRWTDVERPQPPQRPEPRLDASAALLSVQAAASELAKSTDEVSDTRLRLGASFLINWFGSAADRHRKTMLGLVEKLTRDLEDMAVAKQKMEALEIAVQTVISEDAQKLRDYEQHYSEYTAAVQRYDDFIFNR